MDRLSSVLNAFRPKATSVTKRHFFEQHACLPLLADSSYWLYVISGEISLVTKDNRQIELQAGDGIWLAAGLDLDLALLNADAIDQQAGSSLLICEFDFGINALTPLFDYEWQWVKVAKDDDAVQQIVPLNSLLLAEVMSPRCGSQVVIERLAEAYLVQLLRVFMQGKKIQLGLFAGLSDSKLARAIVAIHESPHQAWQVASLAEKAGMSRSAFSGLFKATMGMTPMAYVALWRMRLAAQRIQQGEKNMAMLCHEFGYQSEAAFRRTFKKIMGVAPGGIKGQTQPL